ncbi:MAG: hypothetical protein L3J67_01755 [Hyphomicrobiaceae bacterium]|nr:hypothetical protein [Hyphomicrobiaceae bacterium]
MSTVNNRINEKKDDEEGDEALIPGTMFTERQARILRHAVIIMGITLVAGFALLIGIIVYKASQPAKTGPDVAPQTSNIGAPVPAPAHLTGTALNNGLPKTITGLMPRGAKLLETKISGDRLLLTLQTRQKDLKLILIDLKNWRIIGEALLKQGH